jgi:hypothetical protein
VASAASPVMTTHRQHLNPLKNEKFLTNGQQLNGPFIEIVAKLGEFEA